MESKERKCWACSGIMVEKKDKTGKFFFQCVNTFCGATDTDVSARKVGAAALNTSKNAMGGTSNAPSSIRKKKR